MATTTHTVTSKPTGSPMTSAPEALHAMTETGAAQAKEAYGKISAATADATDLIRKSCSTAVEGAQAYNDKLLAFAQANSKAAFDFAHKLLGVNSPSEFMQLSTEHARKQFEILSGQTKELAALAQKVTLVTTEPLETGVTRAFTHAA